MTFDIRRLDSLTKYPSITTWHDFDAGGAPSEIESDMELFITEKVDGTNGRIVRLGGQWWIGSRDKLLARNDNGLFPGPSNPIEHAIVNTLRPIAERTIGLDHVTAWYFEVFGDGIGAASKEYARRGSGQVSCRLFDHAVIKNSDEVMSWRQEQIAGWRQRGGQTFDSVENLSTQLSGLVGLVPYLSSSPVLARNLPKTIFDGRPFIERWVGKTSRVKLDVDGLGRTEGVVVRTADRKRIFKLRLEDYDKAMRKRFMDYDPKRHAEFVPVEAEPPGCRACDGDEGASAFHTYVDGCDRRHDP